MLIDPGQYAAAPAHDLLTEAARGRIAFDQRLLRALLDNPARMGDIVRFANEENRPDRIDIDEDLMWIFASRPTPDALPFFTRWLRENPGEEPPDMVAEYVARVGEPAASALVEFASSPTVGFLLTCTGVRNQRVREYLLGILAADPEEGAFLLELHRDPATVPDLERARPLAPEAVEKALAAIAEGEEPREPLQEIDIFAEFPAVDWPDLRLLPPEDRAEFLASGSPELRMVALRQWIDEELDPGLRSKVLRIAREDADDQVRATAWDVLRSGMDHRSVFSAMEKRIADPAVTPFERASLAAALSEVDCTRTVRAAIDAAYAEPATRAKALEAMWRSFDPEYVQTLLSHLGDEDTESKIAAINAVGVFRVAAATKDLEPMFLDADLRWDALYAYAVAAPIEDGEDAYDKLFERIEDLAQGFSDEDQRIVESALDMRAEADARKTSEAPAAPKAGRNDPCPCGSGKKFKKCCGAE